MRAILVSLLNAYSKLDPSPKPMSINLLSSISLNLESNLCIKVHFVVNLVSQSKVWPASLRLMDNKQFQFGMALKTEDKNKFQ